MKLIDGLIIVIRLNEFPKNHIDKKVFNKIFKLIRNAHFEIKILLYISWFLYLTTYICIFLITRSHFKSFRFCQFFSRIPIFGKGLNLTFSFIRSAIVEKNYNARGV